MIPAAMRAVILREYQAGLDHLSVDDFPIPQPGDHDVIVKMTSAPVHPSDLAFIQGRYGFRRALPTVPGFEGSGVVLAVGAQANQTLIGQRVACLATRADGTWAQYLCTGEQDVIPLPNSVSDDLAAALLVNPLSAWAMVDLARASGAKAIVQTAAAGALGKMIIRLCQRWGIETINIIRREAQISELEQSGARYILNSSEPTFDKHLRELCATLGAHIAFDAVGGSLSASVLRTLPNGSTLIIYGGLDGQPAQFTVDQFIFRAKQVRGFWLSHWMRDASSETRAEALMDILANSEDFTSPIAGRYPLEQAPQALQTYESSMTTGKVLLIP